MIRKLKQKRGETLVEAMLAMLIAVLSMALLSSTIIVASNVNEANRANDEKFNQELEVAEGMQGSSRKTTVHIAFKNYDVKEVQVDLYGGDGTFISYSVPEEESEE